MKKRQWIPYMLAFQVLLVVLGWILFSGLLGVVLIVVFSVSWLGLIPLKHRR